jgi:transposase
MLPQLSAAVRVFLCTRPTDLRKGFDGLSGLVQECFSQDLLTGHLFLFLNRRRDRMKILYCLTVGSKNPRLPGDNFQ